MLLLFLQHNGYALMTNPRHDARTNPSNLLGITRFAALGLAGFLLAPFFLGGAVAATTAAPLKKGDAAAQSTEPKPEDDTLFMRLREQKKQPKALETAIIRYAPTEKSELDADVRVDLIGAVHIAEPAYYDQLNRFFTHYDSVLYELVADADNNIPEPGQSRGQHPVSALQHMMKNLLELEFQLDGIDYKAENLVHADMTPAQFAQSMRERNESFVQLFLKIMAQSMAKQSSGQGPSDMEILLAFFHKDRALALKRVLAEQMEDMEASLAFLDGPEGSTILTERNKVAMKRLGERIEAGDRKIAIFYGAAHMPDFEERLAEEFGLAPEKTRWIEAWDLDGNADQTKARSSTKK